MADQTALWAFAVNQEEFLACVLAHRGTTARCQSILSLLDDTFAAIQRRPPGVDRRRAQMDNLLRFKEHLLSLATAEIGAVPPGPSRAPADTTDPAVCDLDEPGLRRHRAELIMRGSEHWLSLLGRLRHLERHRVHHRLFRGEHCGDYPFRDADHGPVHVLSADPGSRPASSGRRYLFQEVEPFTCPRSSTQDRARLYDDQLVVRALTKLDLKTPGEQALIGQRGVFARTEIPPGRCLGVYGGQLLGPVDVFLLAEDRYLLSVSHETSQACVNGETLLSMANSLFHLDEAGKVTGHPSNGYNMEMALFPAQLMHGWQILVPAFFATQDIAAGEELRWNYEIGRL